jgi:hypothetical protein
MKSQTPSDQFRRHRLRNAGSPSLHFVGLAGQPLANCGDSVPTIEIRDQLAARRKRK